MADLTKIDKPFGELDIETKLALHRAFYEGKVIEISDGPSWYCGHRPDWHPVCKYRVSQEPLRDISIPRHEVDKRWECAVRDRFGCVFLCDREPFLRNYNEWVGATAIEVTKIFANLDPGNKLWEESMIRRPEGM